MGEGIQNSSCFPCHLVPKALLSPHGSSRLISEAALLRVEPHVSSQMAAPSSDGSWVEPLPCACCFEKQRGRQGLAGFQAGLSLTN